MINAQKMTTRTQFITSISHTWLVLWLVAIPLIHVHPEADHAHGAQKHTHGGLFHSVFSQDLACEFHNHDFDNAPASEEAMEGLVHCQHADVHQLTHDEIGFSLLSGSYNNSLLNHESPMFFPASNESSPPVSLKSDQALYPERSPPSQILKTIHHIRPPPFFSA